MDLLRITLGEIGERGSRGLVRSHFLVPNESWVLVPWFLKTTTLGLFDDLELSEIGFLARHFQNDTCHRDSIQSLNRSTSSKSLDDPLLSASNINPVEDKNGKTQDTITGHPPGSISISSYVILYLTRKYTEVSKKIEVFQNFFYKLFGYSA